MERTLLLEEILAWEREYRRAFVNTLSGAKAAFLLSSISNNTVFNLALVTSVVHLGAAPPLLAVLLRPPEAGQDSRENIEINGYFTLNAVSRPFLEAAHQCSARYPRETSEFEACGLTPWQSATLDTPFVRESPLKMGLKAIECVDVQANNSRLIVGALLEVHLDDRLLERDGQLLPDKADLCGVAGLNAWYALESAGILPFARP